MIICLNSNSSQQPEERHTQLEKLKGSLAPEVTGDQESAGKSETTQEGRKELQPALDLLASGAAESICFRSADVLARSNEDLGMLESFLSKHRIGLTVSETDTEPSPAEGVHPHDIPDAKGADEVDAS